MTFRTRILVACLIVALAPLALFVLGARREVRERLSVLYRDLVSESREVIQQDLARQDRTLETRLRALAGGIDEDAHRRAALLQQGDRASVLDYAASVMSTTGMDYLLLLDSAGRVLSSGHFRNDYDRRITALPALLAVPGPVLVSARRPQGAFLALARAHTFNMGEQRFVLVGGTEVDSPFVRALARTTKQSVLVSLEHPGGMLFSDARTDQAMDLRAYSDPVTLALPFVDDAGGSATAAEARWTIRHELGPLGAILRGMDIWFAVAVAGAIALGFLIAGTLAARVNKPLEELAEKTTRVNLERLDIELATDRADEIGSLSRVLDGMVKRLRSCAQELREAERRATVGDMARQVNHDIRNGLLPIRNVIRHLTEVAHDSPEQLGTVFNEREGTLQGSIGYLESLATNYARLSPRTDRQACDVNAIVRTALRDTATPQQVRVQLELSPVTPRVTADPIALRRVIENLTINALESLPNGTGSVTVRTAVVGDSAERRVHIVVADTGTGMEASALDRIFDDFYTTKERGTGLGLSIVRRLVADMGGRIRVASERGKGSSFLVELPAST